jgi:hypothetical protein
MTRFLRKSSGPLPQVPTLAEAEYKLASTLKTVPEWQWLMMLN